MKLYSPSSGPFVATDALPALLYNKIYTIYEEKVYLKLYLFMIHM